MGYWSGLALCLTKVRSSRACCPATALISYPTTNNEVLFLVTQNDVLIVPYDNGKEESELPQGQDRIFILNDFFVSHHQ